MSPTSYQLLHLIASDVCKALEIVNVTDALKRVDDDDLGKAEVVDFAGRRQPNTNIVNESGMYALIFQSRKEGARRFKKWVTSEVIPWSNNASKGDSLNWRCP